MKTLLLAGLALTAAQAQPTPDVKTLHEAVLKACAADQKKFCVGREGKEGHDCMAANLPKASQACQDAIAKMPKPPPPPKAKPG